MRTRKILAAAIAAAAGALAAPAAAQNPSAVAAAKQAGLIGERFDGYIGYVATPPSAEVRRQAGAVNLRRRNLYIQLGARRNVNPQVAGIATACEILPRVRVGEYYMLGDGAWRKRMPGQVIALPSYCGR